MEFVFLNTVITFFFTILCAEGSGCLFSGAAAVYIGWSWMVSVPTGVRCSCLSRFRLNPLKHPVGIPQFLPGNLMGSDSSSVTSESRFIHLKLSQNKSELDSEFCKNE